MHHTRETPREPRASRPCPTRARPTQTVALSVDPSRAQTLSLSIHRRWPARLSRAAGPHRDTDAREARTHDARARATAHAHAVRRTREAPHANTRTPHTHTIAPRTARRAAHSPLCHHGDRPHEGG